MNGRSLVQPDAVDAKIVKVETTEPTFGTSLDQIRRNYSLPANEVDGAFGLAHIYIKRLNVLRQLRAEGEMAEEEEKLRHKMRMLQIEHEAQERHQAYQKATDVAVTSAKKMIDSAKELAMLMQSLGIDNEDIETEVLRFIKMTVEMLGEGVLVGCKSG